MEYSQKVNTVIMLWASLPIVLFAYYLILTNKNTRHLNLYILIAAITFIIIFTVVTVLMFKTDVYD